MERYGIAFPDHFTELDIERWCFCRNAGPETGYDDALGPAGHARNGIDMLWNYPGSPQKFVWTPWAERMLEAFCQKSDMGDDEIQLRRDALEAEMQRSEEAGEDENSDVCASFESTSREMYVGLAGSGSSGKCLAPDTEVLMFDGSLKKAKNVEMGDQLMGDDSTPRTVLGTNVGMSNMVRIVPVKGDPWECNDDHILSLVRVEAGPRAKHRIGEIEDISVKDYLASTKTFKTSRKLFCVGVDFPEQPIPFDPRVYGLWLGDGSKGKPSFTVHADEREVWSYLIRAFDVMGFDPSIYEPKDRCPTLSFKKRRKAFGRGSGLIRNPFTAFIRKSVHGGEKRIDRRYLINSRAVRMHLLAGIIDSDGHAANKTFYEIACTPDGLKDDICFLARSLGFRVTTTFRTVICNDRPFGSWRINIMGDTHLVPALRKRCKKKKRCMTNTAFEIEQLGEGDWAGFTLDGNGRFLLKDFTVTHNTGMCAVWGIWNYICDPVNTKVFATSTSLKEAHNRVWGQVCRFWSALPFPKGQAPGKVVASLGLINGVNAKGQYVRDRGLELIAGEKKKEEDAIAKLKGFKAPRVIFLADELSDLSPALVTAAKSNLRLNALFTFIGSANPDKFADPFGLLCEPKDGWESISAADEEWESKDGYVLHFDGTRNPNIMAGKDIYPFLMTNQDFKEMKKELGENSRAFWQMVRGYWSPTGKDDAIYTEQALMQADVSQDVTWRGNPTTVAFLDPDFSSDGDGCAFMWGKLGMNTENRMMLKIEGVKYLREEKNNDTKRSFQIVQQCKKLCQELHIRSEHFGFDSTAGAGETFGDIVDEIWAGDVFKLPFSGGASDRKIHYMGERIPAKEQYYNKVTELWYGVHEFLSSGQLAGIKPKHRVWKELTTRLYDRRGKNIVQAEPKKVMRGRIGYSPNEADALVGLIELCRVKLRFNPSGLKHEGREGRKSKWNDFVKKQDPGSRSLSSGVEVAGLLGWD